jgi:hypothetical protein
MKITTELGGVDATEKILDTTGTRTPTPRWSILYSVDIPTELSRLLLILITIEEIIQKYSNN